MASTLDLIIRENESVLLWGAGDYPPAPFGAQEKLDLPICICMASVFIFFFFKVPGVIKGCGVVLVLP